MYRYQGSNIDPDINDFPNSMQYHGSNSRGSKILVLKSVGSDFDCSATTTSTTTTQIPQNTIISTSTTTTSTTQTPIITTSISTTTTTETTTTTLSFLDDFDRTETMDVDGKYRIGWNIWDDGETIEFGLEVAATGWIGLGISPNGQMPLSDIAFGMFYIHL